MRADEKSHFKPEGWRNVTPRVVAKNARELVNFIREVFGAEGDYHEDRPAVLTIGDSMLMISDHGIREPMPAFLYVYVEDADAVYDRAIHAGASTIEKPSNTPYGDRRATVKDEWGNLWQIATRKK